MKAHDDSRATLAASVLLPALLGFVFVFWYWLDHKSLVSLCREDGVIEWLTAVFYILAAILIFVAGNAQKIGKIWFWGLALLFFAIAGEEISWGQRLFSISTPETLQSINVQREMNLHNISGIHDKVRALGLLFILGFCYFLPAVHRVSPYLARIADKLQMPIFPVSALTTTTIGILFMAIPRVFFPDIKMFQLDEIGECYLSFGFFLFALTQWRLVQSVQNESGFGG